MQNASVALKIYTLKTKAEFNVSFIPRRLHQWRERPGVDPSTSKYKFIVKVLDSIFNIHCAVELNNNAKVKVLFKLLLLSSTAFSFV